MPSKGPEDKIIDAWLKLLGKKMPEAKSFTPDLPKVGLKKVRLHAALGKLESDLGTINKKYEKARGDFGKVVGKSNAWLAELRASKAQGISAGEIASRKTMLLKMGIELHGLLNTEVLKLERLAKESVAAENDLQRAKGEVLKAEKLLKQGGGAKGKGAAKGKGKGKGDDGKAEVRLLGKKAELGQEDVDTLKGEVSKMQKDLGDLGGKLTEAWMKMKEGAKKLEQANSAIRAFKAK